jgi:hypothetical protein
MGLQVGSFGHSSESVTQKEINFMASCALLSFIDVISIHLICLLRHVLFHMYLFKISNSGLCYDQPKDSGRRVCLKSIIHLSKYVNSAAYPRLATGVVQGNAQQRAFTADQGVLEITTYTLAIHLCTRKRTSENKRLGQHCR